MEKQTMYVQSLTFAYTAKITSAQTWRCNMLASVEGDHAQNLYHVACS